MALRQTGGEVVYLVFLTGLVGLFLGGDWLVRGASGVARAFCVPPLVIGLVLVGFGTSAPEMMVSIAAALGGQPEIAIGNVIGSNIANLLLILGIAAALGTINAPAAMLRRDLFWLLATAAILVPVLWKDGIGRMEGLVLAAGLTIYLIQALRQAGRHEPEPDEAPAPPLARSLLVALVGLAAVLAGAHFLVDSASVIARRFGVSEAVIGLTIVAIGTSLPELATTISAALKNERDIALGNVIGSNIFNTFGILGATALVMPIPVAPRFLQFDVPVMAAATVAVLALSFGLGKLPRVAGFVALAAYAAYLATTA